ncbi:MAG: hypothetical protein ACYC0H_07720 [Solirubrobacteraceae bacterium]
MAALRWTLLTAAVGAAVLAGAAMAQAAPVASPRAALTGFSCDRSLAARRRSASVVAVMRPLAGTQSMAIRFDLLERAPGAAPADVQSGDLGVWISPSDPTLGSLPGDVWRLSEPVSGLDAPAGYQFRVSFRWTGAQGRVLGVAVRYSRRCWQPQLRADVVVRSISVAPDPLQPGGDIYTVLIANVGSVAAGPLEVTLDPGGGGAAISRTVEYLRARHSQRLRFSAAACTGASPPSASVLPLSQSGSSPSSTSTLVGTCPAAPA